MIKSALAVALCLLPADGHAQPQPPASLTYDAFMGLDTDGRDRAFNHAAPELRAALVQTHIERWIESNRTRLTPAQLVLMLENLGFVTPDHYRYKATKDDLARARDLALRTMAAFPLKDLVQALTFNGPPIPTRPR